MEKSNPDLGQLVPLKNSLAKDMKTADITELLTLRVKALPNHEKYKTDTEVLLLCCSIVEHLVLKTDKIDKQKLVVDSLTTIFSLTEEEQSTVRSTIDFLHNHGRIKSVSSLKIVKETVLGWVQKKFL